MGRVTDIWGSTKQTWVLTQGRPLSELGITLAEFISEGTNKLRHVTSKRNGIGFGCGIAFLQKDPLTLSGTLLNWSPW